MKCSRFGSPGASRSRFVMTLLIQRSNTRSHRHPQPRHANGLAASCGLTADCFSLMPNAYNLLGIIEVNLLANGKPVGGDARSLLVELWSMMV